MTFNSRSIISPLDYRRSKMSIHSPQDFYNFIERTTKPSSNNYDMYKIPLLYPRGGGWGLDYNHWGLQSYPPFYSSSFTGILKVIHFSIFNYPYLLGILSILIDSTPICSTPKKPLSTVPSFIQSHLIPPFCR